MSAADVFVPSDGKELLARSAIGEGYRPPVDAFKKTVNSRPSTSGGGYRFGQLSHNSFFTRHNPHPVRVKHLKGKFYNAMSIRAHNYNPSLYKCSYGSAVAQW